MIPSIRWPLVLVAAATLIATRSAFACAVCFGDPESPIAKGAAAGVMVLIGVVAFVLLGVLGTGLRWVQRGRRLASLQSSGDGPPSSSHPRP